MPAVVTQAKDHVVADSSLLSYCELADVRNVLSGVEPDNAGTSLSGWLSQANADLAIGQYLLEKKQVVDDETGRDFDLHEDVDIRVDGPGESLLDIGQNGFFPLIDVSALSINTSAQNMDNFVWYTDGVIKSDSSTQISFYNPAVPRSFPKGNQNIALTVTWGYSRVPVRIRMAQAQFVAAEVLAHIARSNTESPGMLGGIQQVEYDQFRITNYARSRYSASIERLEGLAKKSLAQFRSSSAVSLVPGGYNNTMDTRGMSFGRSGPSSVVNREPI